MIVFGVETARQLVVFVFGTYFSGGGTMHVQWKQNITDATNKLTVRAGSQFKYRKIN